jgi:phosphoribosylaminoimidazolecarboxamide formyltransferase/IMP cyclohydrolase
VSSAAEGRRPIKRALLSVWYKDGIVELAQALHAAGVQIVSTGSTASTVEKAGVPVTRVEELTGFPEILSDRVKTLHPKVHAGLLADLRLDSHVQELAELGIEPFDLLVSNLYPFSETVASGAGVEDCIAKIDIGGPAMVRSAAKNHASVAVVTAVSAYPLIVSALAEGGFSLAQRQALAARAFADIAEYDVAVARWTASALASTAFAASTASSASSASSAAWPAFDGLALRLENTLRYGENPHQKAALYLDPDAPAGLAQAELLHGGELSFNNYVDADAAWRSANDFTEPCVAIIKHANPCGIAIGADVAEAHRKAHACDPLSAYGGVIAVNQEVTLELAKQLDGILTEAIVAPSYAPEALEVFRAKKKLRVLAAPAWNPPPTEFKQVSGGVLVQSADRVDATGDDPANWTLATGTALSGADLADLVFAWRAVRGVKSNAILLARDGATVGVGMGQVNRVDSAHLAVNRAGAERAAGSVAASDAFFPFPDGLQVLIDAGVKAVVQPGGSIRDEQVIEAAAAAGLTVYLTGTRHFYH